MGSDPHSAIVRLNLSCLLVSATNRNLEKRIVEGAFREDLYYRLNVVPLKIPPLKERPEDIIVLAQHFLQRQSLRYCRVKTQATPRRVCT